MRGNLKKSQKLQLLALEAILQEYIAENVYLFHYKPHDLGPIRAKPFVRRAGIYARNLKIEASLKSLIVLPPYIGTEGEGFTSKTVEPENPEDLSSPENLVDPEDPDALGDPEDSVDPMYTEEPEESEDREDLKYSDVVSIQVFFHKDKAKEAQEVALELAQAAGISLEQIILDGDRAKLTVALEKLDMLAAIDSVKRIAHEPKMVVDNDVARRNPGC